MQTSLSALTTSGDTLVDRRFSYAQDLAKRGDYGAAIDLLDQCLEIMPHWPTLHFYKASYHQLSGQDKQAIESFQRYLSLDQDDRMGAMVKLALLGAIEAPSQMSGQYVRSLFDQYAPRFETSLVDTLAYNVPQRLLALVEEVRPVDEAAERALDLGCGTGLAGLYFKKRALHLEGVDLSSGMVAQAAAKHIYDHLAVGDITTFLEDAEEGAYDLIIAADVFIYLGALDQLFSLIQSRLAAGGLFAFSTQATQEEGYILAADHRYAHSHYYIDRQLAAAGLKIARFSTESPRLDRGVPVPGYLYVAEK